MIAASDRPGSDPPMPDANTNINTKINNDGKNDLADEPDQADETRPTGNSRAKPDWSDRGGLRSDQIRMIR